MKFYDRIKESSTSTGTGTLTLDGAVSGFVSFSSRVTTGTHISYVIAHQSANEWETGIGSYSGTTFTRFSVLESSNSNALVNFSAGTKHIGLTLPACFVPDTSTWLGMQAGLKVI